MARAIPKEVRRIIAAVYGTEQRLRCCPPWYLSPQESDTESLIDPGFLPNQTESQKRDGFSSCLRKDAAAGQGVP